MSNTKNHTFVICAYKNSDYIEMLIESLLAQTVTSKILMSTSTPTDQTRAIAKKYGFALSVNPVSGGIGSDWNHAYALAETDYVTLAHQDDIYEAAFTEQTLAAYARAKNPVIVYTNYFEIRPEGLVTRSKLLRIKSMMNGPVGAFPESRFVRNRVLSMGCPVICPSVTYHKKRFPDFRFDETLKNNLDWDAWYRFAQESGAFVYIRERLLGHRIHEGSETSVGIGSGARSAEDLMLFKRYWPDGIARFIHHFYRSGLKSNKT